MTELHPRECLVRVLSNGQVVPCVKAKTVDAPIASEHAKHAAPPIKQLLPEKFVESAVPVIKSIELSSQTNDNQQPQPTAQPHAAATPQEPRSFGGLRDLLASHSSSRIKLKKDKDKDKS